MPPSCDDDDPFGMFGDDNDNDDDDDDAQEEAGAGVGMQQQPAEAARIAKSLVELANSRTSSQREEVGNGDKKTTVGKDSDEDVVASSAPPSHEATNDEVGAAELKPPSCWREPLYVCSDARLVQGLSSYGGGRGYAAAASLDAGTLVLVEEPIATWPDEQLGEELNLVSVRHLLTLGSREGGEAQRILWEMEHLHPTKEAVDRLQLVEAEAENGKDDDKDENENDADENDDTEKSNDSGNDRQYREQVAKMMQTLRARYARKDDFGDEFDGDGDDDAIAKDDRNLNRRQEQQQQLLQELVAIAEERQLRNSDGRSLTSDDCLRLLLALRYNGLESGVYLHVAMLNHSDAPNCVKFLPAPPSSDESVPSLKCYSEVRTTRRVAAGEPLTISYLPAIACHASRRRHLWEQHRFDVGGDPAPSSLRKMELVNGRLPPSSLDRGTGSDDSVTHRIERAIVELRRFHREAATVAKQQQRQQSPDEATTLMDQLKALEQSALELYVQAKEQLQNSSHILLIPCLELHLDSVDLVQQQRQHRLTAFQLMLLLGRLVVSALDLLELQRTLHGPDHYDLARTNLDLAQAIEELLSKSATHLLQLSLERYNSISAWSSQENKCRKEYDRIKSLYPRDAEDWIRCSRDQVHMK